MHFTVSVLTCDKKLLLAERRARTGLRHAEKEEIYFYISYTIVDTMAQDNLDNWCNFDDMQN